MVAAVSYGEETFVPGLPYDVGSCTDGTGVSHIDLFLIHSIFLILKLSGETFGERGPGQSQSNISCAKIVDVSTNSPGMVRSICRFDPELLR